MNGKSISQNSCPLCGSDNACGNLSAEKNGCWCADKDLVFPESLLQKIPTDKRNRACICKACVMKAMAESI